jgi:hypothetical protein
MYWRQPSALDHQVKSNIPLTDSHKLQNFLSTSVTTAINWQ